MTRKEDWQERLHRFLETRARVPFQWGVNDCCLFVADAVESFTGEDLAKEFRGQYDSEDGARAFGTVEAICEAAMQAHECKESPVLFAQRGDIVLIDGENGTTLGIVALNGTHALFVGPKGIGNLPLRKCRRAWRIG